MDGERIVEMPVVQETLTQRYTERVVRLDSGRFCYTPLADAPPARREPSPHIVFASFNRLAKLNEDVVATWSRILHAMPESRLELRTRMLGDAGTQAHIRARFAAHGIDGERLNLVANVPYRELFDAYAHVDVALDPFPFSGCTTTCDALWMGCPVVTLPGETFVSRQSASLMSRLSRAEWIAHSRDDYVERAVALAHDADALRVQRDALREAVRDKPVLTRGRPPGGPGGGDGGGRPTDGGTPPQDDCCEKLLRQIKEQNALLRRLLKEGPR